MRPEQLTSFQAYTARFRLRTTPSREACLVLHGFPGTVWDARTEKLCDVAAHVTQTLGHDSYVHHYAGLGRSPGQFSFTASITDTATLGQQLLHEHRYAHLHVIGHSWGGVVALNLMERLGSRAGHLVLLSPFSDFPAPEALARALHALCDNEPITFAAGSVDGAVHELQTVQAQWHPRHLARRSRGGHHTSIIQAAHDEEVPPTSTRELVQLFPQPPFYREVASDHAFQLNRAHVVDLITERMQTFHGSAPRK